jgi:hypothetical protein
MLAAATVAASIFLIAGTHAASAAHHRPALHRHHHYPYRAPSSTVGEVPFNFWTAPVASGVAYTGSGSGIVTVSTAAGPITVAADHAGQFEGLINDFVAAGYRPRHIGCFARSHHVRGSLHYRGLACDFDQRGWGRTASFMYTARAHEIIVAHGLRDGREFGDQGHVDAGVSFGGRRTRFARR